MSEQGSVSKSESTSKQIWKWERRDTVYVCILMLWGIVYIAGAATSIQPADNADFLTTIGIRGVAHPSGYPLYTLLGILSSVLWPYSVPVALSILAALTTVGLLLGIYAVVRMLTKSPEAAVVAGCVAATSKHIWAHATFGEVFALLGFFAIWLLFFAVRAVLSECPQKRTQSILLYAALAGLASAHHQTIVFTFPIGLFLIFHVLFAPSVSIPKLKRTVALAFGCFILGFTPYSYVWIQGGTQKIGSWGHIHNWDTFSGHVLRRVYGTFDSGGQGKKWAPFGFHSKRYMHTLIDPLGTFPLGLFALGWLGLGLVLWSVIRWRWTCIPEDTHSFPNNGWLAIALLLTFVLVGPVFLALLHLGTSAVHRYIVERFFVLPDVFWSVFSGIGLAFLFRWVQRIWSQREESYRLIRTSISIVVCAGLLTILFVSAGVQAPRSQSKGQDWIQRYLEDVLRELPPKALLIVPNDDVMCFSVPYLQHVLHIRKDVRFICRAFLSQRWYAERRFKKWPELRHNWSSPVMSSFSIMRHYLKMGRPVHITSFFHAKLKASFSVLPYGLTYAVRRKNAPKQALQAIERRLLHRFRRLQSQHPLPRADWFPWPAKLLRRHYIPPWLMLASLYRQKKDFASARRCIAYAKRWYLLQQKGK